ncbi:MAG: Peptidase S24-like protein [Verrucomicrobia bacterium ADurb.Bin345]|nr:MAG: Peptidase S24-like protein [Verrucomicrobia bacterium ADurb.Bin345]
MQMDEQNAAEVLSGSEAGQLVEAALASGADARFEVGGASMAPTIGPGDVVTVRPASAEDIRVGDVVFYRRSDGSGHVLHRVLWKRHTAGKWVLRTKGDALRSLDPPVAGDQVLGRSTTGASRARAWRGLIRVCGYAAVSFFRKRMKPRIDAN